MDLLPNKSDAVLLPITNTRISASEWNQLVGSCMAFIYAAGFSPDAADNEQFLNAFKKIASELELVGANTALSNLTDEGKIVGAGFAMPSTTFKALTIGASGTTYTAPANGWFSFTTWTTTSTPAYFQLVNMTAKDLGILLVPNQGAGYQQKGFVPAKKGDSVSLYYANIDLTTSGRTSLLFIYADGAISEAS